MELLGLWQSGMVLQRGCENTYYGRGANSVLVHLCGKQYTAKSTKDGFCVTLPSHPAGGPYEMLVQGDNEEIRLTDIYVGDLWLLGGQSNMELPISRTLDVTGENIKHNRSNAIKAFLCPQALAVAEQESVHPKGEWISADTQRILEFSAVGYYFAKNVHHNQNVPVGVIQTAQGGTRIESWMSVQALQSFPEAYEEYKNSTELHRVTENHKRNSIEISAWHRQLDSEDVGLKNHWHKTPPAIEGSAQMPQMFEAILGKGFCGSVWLYKEIILDTAPQESVLLRLGAIVDADKTYINGVLVGETGYCYPPRKYNVPQGVLKQGKNILAMRVIVTAGRGGFIANKKYALELANTEIPLCGTWQYAMGAKAEQCPTQMFKHSYPAWLYNGMIYPLRNTKIKGVAFYQGESNTEKPKGYCNKFLATVACWRALFKNEALPFLFVQLANYDDPVVTGGFAKIREEQREAAQLLQNGGMATAMDLGENNDLHPQNKPAVARRIYALSRKYAYAEQCNPDAPYPVQASQCLETVKIIFANTKVFAKPSGAVVVAIRDKNGTVQQHAARISGNSFLISGVSPNAVQAEYLNSDTPQTNFVYNENGLPCSSFVCNISPEE